MMHADSGITALLERPAWLAPLAGVGDPVFRALCLEQGAGLTYTEMVSAKGLHYGDINTWKLVTLAPGEHRAGVQLFGSEPDVMAQMAAEVCARLGDQVAVLDINMGCPVPKVTRKGEGGGLMRDPHLAERIVTSVVAAVGVPVTVKFRRGWEQGSVACVDFARRMEAAGASLICVHGRSVTQMYRGPADWDIIAETKRAVDIPVLGNGDVRVHADIARMMDETGVDGVLIARGAEGNPWIFSGYEPTVQERVACARNHMRGLCTLDPDHGVMRVRKHMAWYLAGMPHVARIRAEIMRCQTVEAYESLLDQVLDVRTVG